MKTYYDVYQIKGAYILDQEFVAYPILSRITPPCDLPVMNFCGTFEGFTATDAIQEARILGVIR